MIHGDAVPCVKVGRTGCASMDVYSGQSVLAFGQTLRIKMFIWGVYEACKATAEEHGDDNDTMKEAWRIMLWSLWFLYLGIWPTVDPWGEDFPVGSSDAALAGTWLANGLFGVVWCIKGDLDFIAKVLHLRNYNANLLCDCCPATAYGKDDPLYDEEMRCCNFSPKAKWKQQLYSAQQWRDIMKDDMHWIFQISFLSGINYDPDELHIMYLGTVGCLVGSVLWLLCYRVLDGSPSQNLNRVWDLIVRGYKAHGSTCQYSQFCLNFFCNPKTPRAEYPKMKGRGVEIKNLVAPLCDAWRQLMRPRHSEDAQVFQVLSSQRDVQIILDTYSKEVFLPPAEALKLRQEVDILLANYTSLASIADSRGDFLFPMVPKFHWYWHLAERSHYLNPRRGNCCVDEDYVGRHKMIVASCTRSTPMHKVPESAAEKYMWAMHFLNRYDAV